MTLKVRILTLVGLAAVLLLVGAKVGTRAARADCVVNVPGCTPTPSTTSTSTAPPPTTAPSVPGSTTTTTPPPSTATHEDAAGARHLLDLVNGERAKAGAPALSMRDDVRSVAIDWSNHMAAVKQLSHNDAFFTTATHTRLGARTEAENVALNYSVDKAHDAFMNSPHHRDNLMNPTYKIAGFAVVIDGDGEYWVTEDFVEPVAPSSGSAARPAAQTRGVHSSASGSGSAAGDTAASPVAGDPAVTATPTTDGLSVLLQRGEKATLSGHGDGAGAGLLGVTLPRGKPIQLAAAVLLYLMAFFANRAYSSRRKAEINAS